MASYPVLGTGPVTYLDANQSQHSIPLSAITIGGGTASATQWPGWAASPDQALITALLKQLVNQGLLTPGTVPAQPALTITAAMTGTVGNTITVTFSNPNLTVSPATIDVVVTETQMNSNLTLTGSTGLAATLGTSQPDATGLVFLDGGVGNMPAPLTSTPFTATTLKIMDATLPTPLVSFTLEAAVTDDTDLSVTVTNVTASTFTLTVVRTLTQNNVTLSTLTGANPFSELVSFSAPPNGLTAQLPGPGSVTLVGGTAATALPAVAAAGIAQTS
jgi:hypothetical protein